MPLDLPSADQPPDMAVGGAQATVEADPAAIVDAAVQAGTAAPERTTEPTPAEVSALVRLWWDRTAETADFKEAVEQVTRDNETINGGTAAEKDDDGEITVNHVYRNAIQTVALTVPEMVSVRYKPREEVEPLPGMPTPPEVTQRRREQQGLASVVTCLFHRFAEMGNLQEKIEAYVQDSVHYRGAVLKVWFQRTLADDYMSESRLPDEQDLIAKARVLIELYDRGEFTKTDGRYQEMRNALKAIGKTEQDVKRGIMVELRPLTNYRCDPAVTGPEYIDTAAWESDDLLYTREEVLQKFGHIHPDDLGGCAIYQVDETGRAILQEREAKTLNTREIAANHRLPDTRPTANDWLLCREIFDYQTNTRLVLIEGLDYPAVEEPLERGPTGMSPFVLLVENRRSGRLLGYSDTELQAKSQRALNRMRSQEEDGRRNARPKFGANAAAFPHPGDLQKAMEAEPGTITTIRMASAKALTEELVPLAGNHEFNAVEFDGTKLIQEMRKMAMLPEQATGELGNAEFAEEVKSATAGANALARYRQARITRALKRLANKIAELILLNVNQDLAVRLCGPLAQVFYPPEPMKRQEVYEGLTIEVEVALDKQLDYAKRADSLAKLVDAFGRGGVVFDKEVAGKLLSKFLNLGDDGMDLIQSDPNDLVGRLAQSVQENPGALAPEAMLALIQMGELAKQQAAQMMAQQAAAAAGGAPGAPPAQGVPAQGVPAQEPPMPGMG